MKLRPLYYEGNLGAEAGSWTRPQQWENTNPTRVRVWATRPA